jgi:hypothetical protein
VNSIKNAMVTVTLLVVGYGAYVILSNPPPQELDGAASSEEGGSPAQLPDAVSIELGGVGHQGAPAASTTTPTANSESLTPDVLAPQDDYPQSPAPLGVPAADLAREASVSGGAVGADRAGDRVADAPSYVSPSDPAASYPSTTPSDISNGQTEGSEPAAYDYSRSDPSVTTPSPSVGGVEPGPSEFPSEAGVTPSTQTYASPIPLNSNNSAPVDAPISPTQGSLPFETVWQAAQQHLQTGEMVEALANLSDWYGDPTLSREQADRCVGLLDELAGSVIYSRDHHLESAYQVQSGETLADIAERYQVPVTLLARINGIAPPYAVVAGDTLKVIRGPFRGEVSLQQRELTLFLGRFYAGRFPIQIGRDLPPQEAFYEVAEKADGRSYFDRRLGREVLKGEGDNRYGGHWLGLRGDQITVGHSVGIHGRPEQIKPDAEVGSISLSAADADDVHAILSVGSRIHVRR